MKLGPLLSATYADKAPEFPEQKRSAAQLAGLAFERAVMRRLKALHPKLIPGPWILYKFAKKSGICQPDALLWLSDTHCCIIECKLTWKSTARRKMTELYGELVKKLHPEATVSYLQIYKNSRKSAQKKPISIYNLDSLPAGKYKECQWLGV